MRYLTVHMISCTTHELANTLDFQALEGLVCIAFKSSDITIQTCKEGELPVDLVYEAKGIYIA